MKLRQLFTRALTHCVSLALVLVLVAAADACPMCKVALASHDESQGDVIGGFFWSILFMLSMPFVILGTFSGYMYLLVRRARAEQATGQTSAAPARGTGASTTPQMSHGEQPA